jgi:NAD(P)-dependent dehydrogenase (short-subunit alcohol dehydrogenase family)
MSNLQSVTSHKVAFSDPHDPDAFFPPPLLASTSINARSRQPKSAPSILITGAASGIGKGFLQAYTKQIHDKPQAPFTSESQIYVLDLPSSLPTQTIMLWSQLDLRYDATWLAEHVIPLRCDVTDTAALSHELDHGRQISNLGLIVHSAGIRGLVPGQPIKQYSDVAKAEDLDAMEPKTMRKTFEINVMGTYFLMRLLVSSLQNHAQLHGRPAKVVVMGSRLGSVGHNTELGGAYAYRASKAALNAIVKSFSVDIPEAIWTIVHPGRVESALVPIKEDDAMPVEVAVNDLLPLIDGFSVPDSGRFMDRHGKEIPW